MTMKFRVPKRYNSALANEGVWFKLEDENGNHYGDFKCRYLDPTATSTEVTYKRIRAKYLPQIKSKAMSDMDAMKTVFVEAVLVDWRDVFDGEGEPVPFSMAKALEYFSMEERDEDGKIEYPTRWVLVQLGQLSGDVTNYAAEMAIEPVEAIEKN